MWSKKHTNTIAPTTAESRRNPFPRAVVLPGKQDIPVTKATLLLRLALINRVHTHFTKHPADAPTLTLQPPSSPSPPAPA